MSMLLAQGNISVAKEHGSNSIRRDAKAQFRKDAGEVNKSDKGKPKYVVYQKHGKDAGKVKEKYRNKRQKENENVAKYGRKHFTLAGVTSQELEEMDKDPDIIIEKDYLLEGSDSDQAWQDGVDAVAQDAWDVKAVGAEDADVKVDKKVKVAVLDSGLDKFAELAVDGCMNFVNPETEDMGVDTTGHGTAVQNIIMSGDDSMATESVAGKKCGISMYSVKVLDEKNQAPVSRIAAAIQWCMDNEMDIIHMSFGTLVPSRVLSQAVKDAADRGILMIAAAGNGGEAGESTVEYPAAFPEVIGVGSVNQEMEVSEFSSRGEEIELVAPGENVPVSVPWGFYGVNSGTSFAAPHVTAIAGMLWAEDATKSAEDIRSLLRASANGRWEEREGGSGLVDYGYARELAPGYERDEEEKISNTNERELETYDVPEVVQARWASNLVPGLKTDAKYRHRDLISQVNGDDDFESLKFSGNELNILYKTVETADQQDRGEFGKELAKCRVMHAGRYYDTSTGKNNYANYVAAGRCLYNCAYLMWTSNYNKDQLKAYTDKWYNSNVQSATSKNQAKQDLRHIINAAYDHDIAKIGSKVALNRRRQLQFLGFAIHAVTDAFAHQYVINPNDADAIATNKCITKYQGFSFIPISLHYDSFMRGLVMAGSTNTKDLELLAYPEDRELCHTYYADNVSYVEGRFKNASKDAVYRLMTLFQTKNQFDPRAFISNGYKGEATGTYRIPVWNLYENVKSAGYVPEDWLKNTTDSNMMKKIWNNLSFW